MLRVFPLPLCSNDSNAEATTGDWPVSVQQLLQSQLLISRFSGADEGGQVQSARPGAVAEPFDWAGAQNTSSGFLIPWDKGVKKKPFAHDGPSPPVLEATVPLLPLDLLPGVVARPKAPAWN